MKPGRIALVLALALALGGALVCAPGAGADEDPPWEKRRREMQGKAGGLPASVLAEQSTEKVRSLSCCVTVDYMEL